MNVFLFALKMISELLSLFKIRYIPLFAMSTEEFYILMMKAVSVSAASATLDSISEQCFVRPTDGEELKNR